MLIDPEPPDQVVDKLAWKFDQLADDPQVGKGDDPGEITLLEETEIRKSHAMRNEVRSLKEKPHSKALLKPVMCIRLIVESSHLLIPRAPIELDGFSKGVIRFQVQNSDARFSGSMFQRQEQALPQTEATCARSDPHAFEFRWSVLMKLQGAAAHRLLAQAGDEQQTCRRCQFMHLR